MDNGSDDLPAEKLHFNVVGALVIRPDRMPAGVDLTFEQACVLIGADPHWEQGYALWGLYEPHPDTGEQHRQTLVSRLVADTKLVLALWRAGIGAGLPPLVGPDALNSVVTVTDGWPLPLEPVPGLAAAGLAVVDDDTAATDIAVPRP